MGILKEMIMALARRQNKAIKSEDSSKKPIVYDGGKRAVVMRNILTTKMAMTKEHNDENTSQGNPKTT